MMMTQESGSDQSGVLDFKPLKHSPSLTVNCICKCCASFNIKTYGQGVLHMPMGKTTLIVSCWLPPQVIYFAANSNAASTFSLRSQKLFESCPQPAFLVWGRYAMGQHYQPTHVREGCRLIPVLLKASQQWCTPQPTSVMCWHLSYERELWQYCSPFVASSDSGQQDPSLPLWIVHRLISPSDFFFLTLLSNKKQELEIIWKHHIT